MHPEFHNSFTFACMPLYPVVDHFFEIKFTVIQLLSFFAEMNQFMHGSLNSSSVYPHVSRTNDQFWMCDNFFFALGRNPISEWTPSYAFSRPTLLSHPQPTQCSHCVLTFPIELSLSVITYYAFTVSSFLSSMDMGKELIWLVFASSDFGFSTYWNSTCWMIVTETTPSTNLVNVVCL